MMKRLILYGFAATLCLWSCNRNMDLTEQNMSLGPIKYLALGDSYTIGEQVNPADRFPEQLLRELGKDEITAKEVTIIARTGWTTDELQEAIDQEDPARDGPYDLVTLLIGVNNQFRGYPIEQYQTELKALMEQAISFAGGKKERVFILSIPDYGVTPFAQNRNPEKIAREIDAYNLIKNNFADELGLTYTDITPISRRAAEEPLLIAGDRLHPSGEMYALWVEKLLPEVLKVLPSP